MDQDDFAMLKEHIDQRFDGVEKRFDGVEKRVDGVEKRLGERIDERHAELLAKFADADIRFKKVETNVVYADKRTQPGGGSRSQLPMAAKPSQ